MKANCLLIAFLALATMINFSCKKDDNNPIIGTWEEVFRLKEEISTYTLEGHLIEAIKNESIAPQDGEYFHLTVNKNKTWKLAYKSPAENEKIINGTYKIKGNNLAMFDNEGKVESAVNYEISGSTVTWISSTKVTCINHKGTEDETTVITMVDRIQTFKKIN